MNKRFILYTAGFLISACIATVQCIHTGVFIARRFGLAACFAILAYGSWEQNMIKTNESNKKSMIFKSFYEISVKTIVF